ncbi:YwqJ-related putative deaminase [Streptomyces sp. TRM49041]|uniref:YwqJ-related putative deaminase n=1 Tax=Streptomyces sp. TRM49041 TaxID=2603216 RepID=UPI0011EC6175|nr:YwqJ-related putative deaminase [Streptomyces sp. TRM49041]
MSDNQPVNPAEIPVFTGDEAALDAKVKAISGHGVKVAAAAGDVHTTFGGLRAFYQAPEADQLFATTRPVADKALTLSSDMCVIAGALGTYANDIRPLAQELDRLKREAETFRSRIAGDDEWREDGDLIDENRARRDQIAELWTQFQEAERACHSKIVALVGGTPLKVNDGSNAKDMYGYDAEALKQAESLPWGDVVDESIPGWQFWEHGWEFGKGVVVDGVWGTLVGLGTLAGFKGGDAAGEAWSGLAALGTGLGLSMLPATRKYLWDTPPDQLPAEFRKARTAVQETGKAFLAWDKWESNPSRAAGEVTFNVLTTVFTGGAGGAAAGAGKAGAVAKALSVAGKASRAIDPMTYAFKGASGLMKIGDVMTGLKGIGAVDIPKIDIDGAVALPHGSKILPDGTIHLPSGAPIPEGALRLPEGTVKLPEGTVTLPPGTVKLPVDGPAQYMDPPGNIYDADGTLIQKAQDAPTGKPAADANTPGADTPKTDTPKTDTPATATIPERELAAVGARNDNGTRLGSNTSDPTRHTDDTQTPRPDTTPGGTTPDNMPRNSADNMPPSTGSSPRPDTPSPGGHADTPSTGNGGGPDFPGGRHRDSTPGSGGSDGPAVPHQGEPGDGLGMPGHDRQTPHSSEGHGGTLDHNTPGSAATPEEALSPDTHVGENGTVPPPGHGQKLLEQIDAEGPRVTKTDGTITHVDGRPVADYLDELAQQRGSAYRDARDSGAFPRKQTGACVGAVMDLRTGTIIEGINGKADVVIKLDDLHPTLLARLETIGDPPPHKDDPLGHAEVKAANELLWMRKRQGLPDDAFALAQMRASVDFPYLNDIATGLLGRRAPFCANCNHMLQGLPSSHGRFTGFPPSEENWIP